MRRVVSLFLIASLVTDPAIGYVANGSSRSDGVPTLIHQQIVPALFGREAIAAPFVVYFRHPILLHGGRLKRKLLSKTRGLLSQFFGRPAPASGLTATVGVPAAISISRRTLIRGVIVLAVSEAVATETFFLTSCGAHGPPEPPILTAPPFAIAPSPTSVDFGDVPIGTSASLTVEISNTGTNPITVSPAITGSGFQMAGFTSPTIAPQGKSPVIVLFTPVPATPGQAQGNLTITSANLDSPVVIPLLGNGIPVGTSPTSLGVAPPAATGLNFGTKLINTQSTLQIQLTHTGQPGDASITVSKATVYSALNFTLNDFMPATLTPQQSMLITVIYQAIAGLSAGELQIETSAGPIVTPLSGAGIHTVALSWNQSTSVVVGCNVYRKGPADGAFVKINSSLVTGNPPTFVDITDALNTTYQYYVTAIDSSGTESGPSNIIIVSVPAT